MDGGFVLPESPEDDLPVDGATLDELEEDDELPEEEESVELPEEEESVEPPVLDFPSVEPDDELPDSDCIAFFRDSEG